MLKEHPSEGDTKVVHALPKDQFNSIIRNINKRATPEVQGLLTLTFTRLKVLKVQRDLDEALPGVPKGSDHFDLGTFKTWLEGIKATDEASVEQLIAIDATAKVRVTA